MIDIQTQVDRLDVIEKAKLYLSYFIDRLCWIESGLDLIYFKERTFEEFCSEDNIHIVNLGADWKERGYATPTMTQINIPSLQWYYSHNL